MGIHEQNVPGESLGSSFFRALVLGAFLALFPGYGYGQIPLENGITHHHFAGGMYAPTEMAFDSAGNLFCGSGYEPNWPYSGAPTPVFKVLPDGTVAAFSTPISDPDALTVGPDDNVYVGSWGGIITFIDGQTEMQSLWLADTRLKNIDGLRFSPSGELFTVAIDSSKVYRIDPATKAVNEFADLSSLGITGMSGIAFDPHSDHVFVASPLENVIVELDGSGAVVNPQVANGFLFLGYIDFDPTGANDGYLFAPDALGECIYRVDLATGEKKEIIAEIAPGPVGIAFHSNGDLYFNMNYDQVMDGEVFRAWPMEVHIPSDPNLGDTVTLLYRSRHDPLVPYGGFLGLSPNGPTFPDGRQFPISLTTYYVLLAQSLLDGNGEASMDLSIPMDSSFSGLTVYFAFLTYQSNPFQFLGFSKAEPMTIH